jgi:D-alanyl-D-alanine carboxypeptidase
MGNIPAPERSADPRACVIAAYACGVPHDYARGRMLRYVREPRSLAFIGHDTQKRPQWLAPRAARAWARMRDAAVRDDVQLQIVSAFRSVEYQLGILKRKLDGGQSIEKILRVSAAPGYSEHHSGRALDLSTPGFAALEEEFENSAAFAWLSTNAQNYGFRLSYPRSNVHGIAYEPWHWCWHAPGRSPSASEAMDGRERPPR